MRLRTAEGPRDEHRHPPPGVPNARSTWAQCIPSRAYLPFLWIRSKQLIGSIAVHARLLSEMGNTQAVLYGDDGSYESTAMADLLNALGVAFEYRAVNRDEAAAREWEQLDGDRLPVLRFGNNSFVRGFDRIKIQQLFGWVGC